MGGCNCKNNIEKRAQKLVYGRKWEQLDEMVQGQLGGLYNEKYGEFPTDDKIRQWLKI